MIRNDLMEIRQKAGNLFLSMKLQFLTAAVIPVLVGSAFYFAQNTTIYWLNFLLSLFAIIFLHISGNMFNDYFDHLNGTDGINTEFIKPFTGGSRVIQEGLIKPYQVLGWATLFLLLGSGIGFFLVLRTGIVLLFIGLIGFVSIIFYVNRKFSLAASGFGELTIFLNFGILPVLGSYYVQSRMISPDAFLLSLPVGSLITAVLYINQFPDYAADKATGKKNLVVRLGRKRARWGYVALIIFAYIMIVILIIMKIVPLRGVFSFFTIPLALLSSSHILRFYENTKKLVPAIPSTIFLHLAVGYFLVISLLYNQTYSLFIDMFLILGLIFFIAKAYPLYKLAKNNILPSKEP